MNDRSECPCEEDHRPPRKRIFDNTVRYLLGGMFTTLMYLTVGKAVSADPGIGVIVSAVLGTAILFASDATFVAWSAWHERTEDAARRDHDDANEPGGGKP